MLGRLLVTMLLLAGGAAMGGETAVSERAVEMESRPGVVTAYYLAVPAAPPVAAAILFTGGEGSVGVRPGMEIAEPVPFGRGNFLVRTRRLLASAGILVATIDAPSDQGGGMTTSFRLSDEHMADIAALAAVLKRENGGIPVWLIGTSMGTLSAAQGAARLGDRVDGLILTSSITRGHRKHSYPPNGVLGLGLDEVTIPALVVAHAGDACEVTPPADAPRVAEALAKSRRRDLLMVEGGAEARSGACEAMSPHGYFGREQEVVAAMAAFITRPDRR